MSHTHPVRYTPSRTYRARSTSRTPRLLASVLTVFVLTVVFYWVMITPLAVPLAYVVSPLCILRAVLPERYIPWLHSPTSKKNRSLRSLRPLRYHSPVRRFLAVSSLLPLAAVSALAYVLTGTVLHTLFPQLPDPLRLHSLLSPPTFPSPSSPPSPSVTTPAVMFSSAPLPSLHASSPSPFPYHHHHPSSSPSALPSLLPSPTLSALPSSGSPTSGSASSASPVSSSPASSSPASTATSPSSQSSPSTPSVSASPATSTALNPSQHARAPRPANSTADAINSSALIDTPPRLP